MDEEYFWNIWRIWEEESTRDGARGGCYSTLAARKLIFGEKSGRRFQSNRSSPYIYETVKGQKTERRNRERQRDIETDPISEGLSPLQRHGDHGPEGKPFSHLGRRSRKNKKEGGSLPLASGGAGTPPGPSSSPQSSPTPPSSLPTSSSPSPIYLQQSTLPQPTVPST